MLFGPQPSTTRPARITQYWQLCDLEEWGKIFAQIEPWRSHMQYYNEWFRAPITLKRYQEYRATMESGDKVYGHYDAFLFAGWLQYAGTYRVLGESVWVAYELSDLGKEVLIEAENYHGQAR